MKQPSRPSRHRRFLSVASLAAALIAADAATAQSTRATIRGVVANAASGAQVSACNVGTGATITVPVGATGNYVLAGLPPGTYDLFVAGADGAATAPQRVIVSVGQAVTFNLDAGAEPAPAEEAGADIVVVGNRLIETRTSEVATNVSTEQIRTLPQTDRNFLSFAQLAPGVRYNDSETNRGFTSGASTAAAVNVFIDGQNLKNNVLDQGVAGQQDSRGNPFAQLAVQEFRVLTQNYKAEYEQASAAIITAITKSGTNRLSGELFGSYTDRNLSAANFFDLEADRPKPPFERKQYGASLGGPIIKDRLFFFGAYEGNDQDRAFNVIPGGSPALQAAFEANSGRQLSEFEGAFVSPFRADLFFFKLTFISDDRNTLDLSYNRREETDIQGFGGTQSFEIAENKINQIDTINFKHTHRGEGVVNEFSFDYLNYNYNPTSLDPNSPTFEYQGVIVFGGKDGSQDIRQQALTLRNDLSLTDIEWNGRHLIKFGIKYSIQDYEFNKLFFVQPRFLFRNDVARNLDFSFPAEAQLGLGDPRIAAENRIFGIYIQDDWRVNEHLTLNIGVRWDHESNLFNNNYVTPPAARQLLLALPETSYFRGEDFVTDGRDRPTFKGAIQPRIGFAYDVGGDERTVIFGGYGRYYDRNVFNNTLDERFRLQYTIGRFNFSRDGQPRDGNPTVVWDNRYLTREGLLALQAQALTGLPELFAVKNRARPPRTDQFSLGVRQRFGDWNASITASYIKGNDGYTHLFATRNPDGSCCDTALARSFGFSNVLIGVDQLETRYRALYFTLDKPYTRLAGWGVNVAYTLSKAEQNGDDLFSLDKPTPAEYGFRPRTGDERHAIVLSGQVDLPWGLRASTLSSFGSGAAFRVFDATNGFSVNNTVIRAQYPRKNCIGIFARCEVNLTLAKEFAAFDTHTLGVALDLFNAFNNRNFGGFEGFLPPEGNPRLGEPSNLITLPRRLQFRAFYRF
jgi:hypothetical protein